jgi:hypothetical protein
MEETQYNEAAMTETMAAPKKGFSIKDALRSGWEAFKSQWSFYVLAVIATAAVLFVINALTGISTNIGVIIVVTLASWILQVLITLGWITIFLKAAKGEQVGWPNFQDNVQVWWKYILANILYQIIVGIGFLLLIVPGIYFALKYQLFMYALVDKKDIGIWESFQESARLTKGVKWQLFGLWFVFLGVAILGFLALIVGFAVAWIVMGVAMAYIYHSLKAQTPEMAETA